MPSLSEERRQKSQFDWLMNQKWEERGRRGKEGVEGGRKGEVKVLPGEKGRKNELEDKNKMPIILSHH